MAPIHAHHGVPAHPALLAGNQTAALGFVLTLLAVPLSRLRPRQGRYARIGLAILLYFVYSNLLSAAKVWLARGTIPPAIGLWWVHGLIVAFALLVLMQRTIWLRLRPAQGRPA